MDNINNPEADLKPENNNFNAELKRMIEQIKSIREIEWRTNVEEDRNMREIRELLKDLKNAYSENSNARREGRVALTDSIVTSQQNEDSQCNKQFEKWEIKARYCWITVLVILAIFAFDASWLVIKAGSFETKPCNTIPFIAGGAVLLLFLALIIIVLARQSKFIMGCKVKAEDE